MAYNAPSTRSTGDLCTAAIWNADVVANEIAIYAGALSVTSQAVGDILYASSTTQFARVAAVATGQVLASAGTGTIPAYSATPALTSVDMGGTTVYGSRAITVDTGGVLNVVLASSAGDDFTVDTDKLVVSGDSGAVGIGTAAPVSLLDVRGPTGTGATPAGLLTLATAELTVVDNDQLGRINFQAPLESSGSDAILAVASIYAEATATFSATVNSTDLIFATATDGAVAERVRIDSTGHLLVGHTSAIPGFSGSNLAAMQVTGTGDDDSTMQVARFSNNNATAQFSFLKSRGSIGANTIVQDNDRVGCINYLPNDGSDFNTHAACFKGEVDDASPAAGDIGMAFVWEQHPGGGGGALVETMRISAAGLVGINQNTPTARLHVKDTSTTDVVTIEGDATSGLISRIQHANHIWRAPWLRANGDLRFYNQTDGRYTLTLTEAGLVGINTAAPVSLLDVRGPTGTGTAPAGLLTLATDELTIVDGDQLGRIEFRSPIATAGTDAIVTAASIWSEANATFSASVNSADIVFATAETGAAVEHLRLDSRGTMRYGYEGTGKGTFQNEAWGTVLGNNAYYNGSAWVAVATGASSNITQGSAGDIIFRSAPSVSAGASTSAADNVTINANGYVGIGIVATHKLHVSGDIKLQNSQIQMTNGYGMLWGTTGLYAYADTNYIRFDTGGAEAMRIISGGNVGIGLGDPAHPLEVKGGVNNSSPYRVPIATFRTDSYAQWLTITGDGSGASGGHGIQNGRGTGVPEIFITSGKVGIGTTSPRDDYKLDVSGAGGTGISVSDSTNISSLRLQMADATATVTIAKNGAVSTAINFITQASSGATSTVLALNANVATFSTDNAAGDAAGSLVIKSTAAQSRSSLALWPGPDGVSGYRSWKLIINKVYNGDLVFQNSTSLAGNPTTTRMSLSTDGNLSVVGALSKGSGSFKIDHPLPAMSETHKLVHSFIEGPRADLIYRGMVELVDGAATVDLDVAAGMSNGTWVLLCRDEQVFTTNETGWFHVRGSVSGSTLTIDCEEDDCTDTISWMVVAERQDQHILDTNWTDEDGRPILEPLQVEDPLASASPSA